MTYSKALKTLCWLCFLLAAGASNCIAQSNTTIRGEVDDVASATCAEGAQCTTRISPARGMHVTVYDESGTEVGLCEDATLQNLLSDFGTFVDGEQMSTISNGIGQIHTDLATIAQDITGDNGTVLDDLGAIRTDRGIEHTTISGSTSETTIVTAASSIFKDLYGLILNNTGGTTTVCEIRDSTSGSIQMVLTAPTATGPVGFTLPVGSAVPQTTSNNNWTATCSPATSDLEVTALYVNKS